MTELFHITSVGVAAMFFIVVLKLITTRYYVPGLSEVVAMA
ncbi:MAG: hypothetical protein ACR2OE_01105 [Thermomicrobiales bacterium]